MVYNLIDWLIVVHFFKWILLDFKRDNKNNNEL